VREAYRRYAAGTITLAELLRTIRHHRTRTQ
jgi:hypothetical protein